MLTKKEILQYPNYLLSKYQLEIYRQVVRYMENNKLSKTDLANQMGVSNSYISQILNGNFNYTLKKLIEIGLVIGQVLDLKFIPVDEYKVEGIKEAGFSGSQVKTISIPESGHFLSSSPNINIPFTLIEGQLKRKENDTKEPKIAQLKIA